MKRSTKLTSLAVLPLLALSAQTAQAQERPNVIWYMIEDTSPQYIGLYNNGKGAKMPNLEKFAKNAIIYDNAFSSAPVSSAARTTLITGCYAPRFGGSLHRRLEEIPMPEGLRMFPSYLREAGYYTVNAIKTDYTVELDETAWDKISGKLGDWNNRKDKNQPFFFVRTNTVTHEGCLLFNEEKYNTVKTETDPNKVYVHPNLKATDLMKYTYATFYDKLKAADEEFGKMLAMLEKDGLMDNTFIFFFGDNGGTLPQSKGYANDTGFRVPLLVYIPEKYRADVGLKAGKHTDGIVSFMDFGATVMNLAGIKELPEQMNGRPFLGKDSYEEGRESLVCYTDRFDDSYAFNRVLYRGDFRYGRNYTPYHMRGLYGYYRYRCLAMQEAREMFGKGELNELQSRFFEPQGCEELFDLKNDPNETRNLANDPKYRAQLIQMRSELACQVDNYCDLGFLPETIITEKAFKNPERYGFEHQKDLVSYRMIADLQLQPLNTKTSEKIVMATKNEDEVAQWWGLTTGAYFGDKMSSNKEYVEQVNKLKAKHNRSYVRSRAFVADTKIGGTITPEEIKDILSRCRTLSEVLYVLNDVAYLRDTNFIPAIELSANEIPFVNSSVEERITYLSK